MPKKSRAPAARGFTRQTLYVYVLLIAAAPTLAVGLSMTPNHKRARGWEEADRRYVIGYYLTLVGSVLGVLSLTALLVDHSGPSGGEGYRGGKQDVEDEE